MNYEPEMVKASEVKAKMTPAERMARARAARAVDTAKREVGEPPVQRTIKKAPIVPEEPVASARTQTRDGARPLPNVRGEVIGHNGEVLSRTPTQVGDIFDIPQSMIPNGWTYQWNAVS